MIELIKEILSHEIHEAELKFPSELERLGWELFGIKPCGCGFRLIEIYLKLHKNGLKKAQAMIDNKRTARLKDGVVLRIPQMGITWTNISADFTDKKAVEVLNKYQGLKGRFEILPHGFEAGTAKTKQPKKKKPTPAPAKPVEKTAEEVEVEAEIEKEEKAKNKE